MSGMHRDLERSDFCDTIALKEDTPLGIQCRRRLWAKGFHQLKRFGRLS